MTVGSVNADVAQNVALYSVKSAMKQQESQATALIQSLQQSAQAPTIEPAPRKIDLFA